MKARAVLLAAGTLFGSIELQDTFRLEVWVFPLVFAALFFSFAAWYWQRDSLPAAGGLVALFAFEAAEAPGWLGIPVGTKVFCIAVSVVGIFAAVTVLLTRLREVRQTGRQRSH
jgi:hypothetical protein